MNQPLAKTPLYAEHVRLGARLVPFAGYEMPVQYSGISAEHTAVRTAAGLFDVSHMGEIEIDGADAVTFVNGLCTNDLGRVADGQAMYTCCCNERGTILDDLIVYRRAPDRVLVVCNASNRDKIVAHFAAAAKGRVGFRDASDETSLIALQGPLALGVLVAAGSSIADPKSQLGAFRFRDASIAGKSCTIARTGYTGEDGVEIFCANADAPGIWGALYETGKRQGLLAAGLGARDTLRLEARLSLYGNDIDETTDPLEAGLGWTVKLDKPDFVGKAALVRIKQAGSPRKMVGFEMTGRGVARHGYPLCDEAGKPTGICTSGAPSPTLGRAIGMGYVPTEQSAVGTPLSVDCRGKPVGAVIVKTPFYKRAS